MIKQVEIREIIPFFQNQIIFSFLGLRVQGGLMKLCEKKELLNSVDTTLLSRRSRFQSNPDLVGDRFYCFSPVTFSLG